MTSWGKMKQYPRARPPGLSPPLIVVQLRPLLLSGSFAGTLHHLALLLVTLPAKLAEPNCLLLFAGGPKQRQPSRKLSWHRCRPSDEKHATASCLLLMTCRCGTSLLLQ